MDIPSKYAPEQVENKWYDYWMKHGFFRSVPDGREPYTIVIPPPNVTGVLHMGHMLNNTIQDVLVRRARMTGKNACWVPGTDHASIATEARVVAKLAQEGVKKSDLTREQFLEHAWDWTHKHGGIILEQLKKLGASCDWERTCFTMDDARSESVIKAFVDLYKKGLVYRGVRMVNWDPAAKTALSDEEVNYKEQQGKLYYLRYNIAPPSPPEGGGVRNTHDGYGYLTANAINYGLLKEHAQNMRKFSTVAESALWEMLRGKNLDEKFRRQHIIGDVIVDFVSLRHKLVIEVDGGYHNDPEIQKADKIRTEYLESHGYSVVRFTNEEVLENPDEVLGRIKERLAAPPSPPERGGVRNTHDEHGYLTANALNNEQILEKSDNAERGWLRTSPPSGGLGGAVIVATTRPETILGDTAVCINPNDPKTAHLKGKRVIVPIANREVPIIEDEYVDMEFGTGCLKVTPAHDVNDYMLGEKYNLESIDIFNDDGTLNKHGLQYEGMDRFEVRKQIEQDLIAAGLMEKVEPYVNNVGFSERTDVPIEPKLSMQWFLKMGEMAKPAFDAVMEDDVMFHPAKFKNTYRHWMENIKDWCISRQLWWGHRIPAYYLPEGGYVVAETPEKALAAAREKSGNPALRLQDLRQDDDCLDTWFSSWLWPLSVFDGINNPDNDEIKYYYPTNDLVTAPEIIFFWVARMIMAGYEYRNQRCFRNVYFTGIVRDKLGRKMSKSLGNSPDPIVLMNQYSADGVRMGMLLCSAAGNDILFDESQVEQGRNFCNKIWNAFRLVKGWESDARTAQPESSKTAILWFGNRLHSAIAEVNDHFEKFRISDALMTIYKLIWDDFCSWYLEIIKPAYQQPIDVQTLEATTDFFDRLMRLLHPFMPFLTEEIWQWLRQRKEGESIMVSDMPAVESFDNEILRKFDYVTEVIVAIRTQRAQRNILNKEAIELFIKKSNETQPSPFDSVIAKLCNISKIEYLDTKPENCIPFIVRSTEFFIPISKSVNKAEEIEKLTKELEYTKGFLTSVMQKLNNERFVNNAPEKVLESERKKKTDAEARILVIEEQIKALKS
ncbi:MAG: valine--tRNA ligase [Bacteroidales bacterium]|nr:valine--tRNA ligase [Bacteroidales bacterium]